MSTHCKRSWSPAATGHCISDFISKKCTSNRIPEPASGGDWRCTTRPAGRCVRPSTIKFFVASSKMIRNSGSVKLRCALGSSLPASGSDSRSGGFRNSFLLVTKDQQTACSVAERYRPLAYDHKSRSGTRMPSSNGACYMADGFMDKTALNVTLVQDQASGA